MTRTRSGQRSECHVLNFFCDDEDGCALTVLVNGVRFHIIAELERLKSRSKSGKGKELEEDYRRLLNAARDSIDQELDDEEYQDERAEDSETQDVESDAEARDSGHGSSDIEEDEEDDSDSAVDVTEENEQIGNKKSSLIDSGVFLIEADADIAEQTIHNWILEPFGETFEKLAPLSNKPEQPTVYEWFNGLTYFFNLENKEGVLTLVEEESQPDLEQRIKDLTPRMTIPKYIKDFEISWFNSKDVKVLSEAKDPEPCHPCRVQHGKDIYFLKMVDLSQPGPTKREIKLMKTIEKKGLHKKMRVPLVEGLVGFEDSKSEIMGFLQTEIEDPTPLTKMLDSDVIEEKREKWAKESERMVELLHENGIVWGDAKADNFMVDKHGELWIIDFGGSYTEGWVDPELNETIEGDDMGIAKIVGALEDPEANTYDPGDDDDVKAASQSTQSGKPLSSNAKSRKRSRDDEEEGLGDEESASLSKKQKNC